MYEMKSTEILQSMHVRHAQQTCSCRVASLLRFQMNYVCEQGLVQCSVCQILRSNFVQFVSD